MKNLILAVLLSGATYLPAAETSPGQLAELLANKQFRPEEVTLGKPVKIDVFSGGKKTGEITVPVGRAVKLRDVQDQKLRILVGTSEATVPYTDTDYVNRAEALRKEWDKKSLAEKRARLIADSPKAAGAAPASPTPHAAQVPPAVTAESDVPADPSSLNPTEKTDDLELGRMDPQKRKAIRFLTSQPLKCMENGQVVATSTFKSNGTYVLDNGYKGKWKMDKTGEIITYCDIGGKDRINRYVYDEKHNKLTGKRDRKSDIQDNASLYMMPAFVKK